MKERISSHKLSFELHACAVKCACTHITPTKPNKQMFVFKQPCLEEMPQIVGIFTLRLNLGLLLSSGFTVHDSGGAFLVCFLPSHSLLH